MFNDKSLFYKRQIFWLWVLMITMVCTSAYFLYYTVSSQAGSNEELNEAAQNVISNLALEVIATFLTVIIFVYFYDSYTRKNSQSQTEKSIVQSLLLNDEVLESFKKETKFSFLKKILGSIIGIENATILYESVLKNHLSQYAFFRDTQIYDVEVLEPQENFILKDGYVLEKEKHYEMSQRYLAVKRFALSENQKVVFRMLFTCSEQSLDYWLKDKQVFMREIISIAGQDLDLVDFTPAELTHLVQNIFGLRIKFYDENKKEIAKKPTYSVSLIHSDQPSKAIEVKIDAKQMAEYVFKDKTSGGFYFIGKVSFRMPLSKLTKRFHYVVSEPTNAPRFSFKHDKSFKNIDYITYFAQTDEPFTLEREDWVNKFTFQTEKVVFPRSGIVFFWD